jgi:regulator of protease activity HflC (stomatin/prohibitin superfamily)
MSIIDVIDQLEGLLAGGRRVVFTPNVIVNEEEALELIDRARLEVPEELKQAHWTAQERERLIAEAEATAEAIRVRAEEEAAGLERSAAERCDALVAESEVARRAEESAAAMLADAEASAELIRNEADTYVRNALTTLEQQLSRLVAEIHKGVDSLPGTTSSSPSKRSTPR